MMLTDKIYIAGHNGMVGRAIVKTLQDLGYTNLLFKSSHELDLRNQADVNDFFNKEKPTYVFLAAAKVGGILANNNFRADFIYDNLQIEINIIHSAYKYGVTKLLFLGSSCIYPKFAKQPMSEEDLLTGELEYTNEPFAMAKIAGLKLCESYNLQYGTNFISVMPTNLYGIYDNFDLENSHVLPALIKKFHIAKILANKEHNFTEEKINFYASKGITANSVMLWGTGEAKREFLYVDDLAEACVFLMNNINFNDLCINKKEIRNTHINVGTGNDIKIKDLATIIAKIIGYNGTIEWDSTKPDGTPRKLLNVDKINNLGWKAKMKFENDIAIVYDYFCKCF